MRGTRAQTGRELTSYPSPQRTAPHGSSAQAAGEQMSADGSSQSGAQSPPVSITSSSDLLLQSSPPFVRLLQTLPMTNMVMSTS